MYGTRVLCIKEFGEDEQLHGRIIIQLKKRWPCTQHQGEHGEPGYCYITPSAEHVGLNNRKLKIWATAIVSKTVIIRTANCIIYCRLPLMLQNMSHRTL
jgi:hypothetical protein